MSISRRLALIVFILTSLSLSMVFLATYQSSKKIMSEVINSRYVRIAEDTSRQIDNFLFERSKDISALSGLSQVRQYLSAAENLQSQGAINIRLKEIRKNDPGWMNLFITDTSGKFLMATDRGIDLKKILGESEYARFLSDANSGKDVFSDAIADGSDGMPTIIFASPVFAPESEKLIVGIFWGELDWGAILSILKEVPASFAHILNRNGLEIASNNPDFYKDILEEDYSENADYKDMARSGASSSIIREDLHGNFESITAHAHEAGYETYGGNSWITVIEDPATEILMPARKIVLNNSLWVLLGTIISASLGFLFTRWQIINPVKNLSEFAGKISAGDMSAAIPAYNSKDEMSAILNSLKGAIVLLRDTNKRITAEVDVKTRSLEKELELKDRQEKNLEKNKTATLNLLEDISIEKARVDALVSELSKFQLAVEDAYEHIIITDTDGTIVYANKAAERITGYARGEIIGNRPSLWGKQMSKEFYEAMWKTIKTDKKVFIGELRNRRKNGVVYDVNTQITPIMDKNGDLKFFVAIERDITEQKRLEDARISFISVASHQLRTPLTSIKWISELLLSGDVGPVPEKQKEFVEDLYVSSRRMINLVNSLLNIARIESTELRVRAEAIDFRNLYSEILKELDVRIKEKGHSISLTIGNGAEDMHTDSKLLYEILKNILTNSIKYTDKKGVIKVAVKKSNDEIVISVSDNGIGIPKDEQPRVFEKFFRGTNAVKISTDGTGLGMYIVKNLADLLSGRVWFESEENKGTVFYLALPAAGPRAHEGSKMLLSSN